MKSRGILRDISFVLALIILITWNAWACSGPGAMERIEAAEQLGWLLFGITALVGLAGSVLVWRLKRGRWQMFGCLIPVFIHPGWWLSARGGDCGAMRAMGSWIGVGLAVIVPLALLVAGKRKSSERE